MAGLEYLEAKDPLDDNYYRSGLLTLAVEIGVLGGGAKLLKGMHRNALIETRGANQTLKESYKTFRYYNDPGSAFKEAKAFSARDSFVKKASTYKGAAKTLNSLGKMTGVMGMFTLGFDLSRSLMGTSQMFIDSKYNIDQARRRPIYNSEDSYFDSRAAFTQRQRAIQVIHNSQMSTRAAMGSESSFMHY